VPAMSKRSVGFHLKSRCGDARRRACWTVDMLVFLSKNLKVLDEN